MPFSLYKLAFWQDVPVDLLCCSAVLSMNSRPDIAYAVGLLSRFDSKPTLTTCHLMTYLTQYARGTVSKGIQFSGSMFDMHIFTGADWAGDVLTRRSTTGYIVLAAGGTLSWQSKLQTTVSTSRMQISTKPSKLGCRKSCDFGGCCSNCNLD